MKLKPGPSDFPGGPVVKNSPCNAWYLSSVPGWGTKIPHATEQLSLCVATAELTGATTREPVHHKERSYMTQLRSDAVK